MEEENIKCKIAKKKFVNKELAIHSENERGFKRYECAEKGLR